jgi:SIT4 phosphatase-associated protein.
MFVLQWLKEKQLIQQVCSKLDPSQTSDDHDNAATILVRIIDSLRKEDDCSVLLASMESEETIRTLLELGLNSSPRTESCVTSCVEILLQLLDVNNK